jgi:SAM-dependent methyltransferase
MAQSSVRAPLLHLGTADDFARVRSALQAAGFDEATLCQTLKIEGMSDIGGITLSEVDFSNVTEQLQLFIRLFFCQRLVPRAEVERVLDQEILKAFLSLGILGADEFGADNFYARVLLYPVAEFLMASDRHTNPDGSEFNSTPDIVFPAIYGGTLRFIRLLPQSPAAEVLDLCAGTGIGAFVLSRCSKRATSSDVTERATHFALFNRALNNLGNVDVLCGDLYDAVAGKTFDRIVAHPPYVPSLNISAIWRDGGTTGDLLVKRIIEGLPQYLRAGGISCIVSIGLDTKEGKFEDRARSYLQDSADEFDIIFAGTNERTADEVLHDLSERDPSLGLEGLRKLKEAFDDAGIVRMPYGALVMRRHAAAERHQAWTLRTRLSDATDGPDFERSFTLHSRFLQPDFVKTLAQSRPVLAPHLEVKVTHVVYERALVPAEVIFETDKPFQALGRVDRWMVPLFTRFDGSLTTAEIYDQARLGAEIPDDFEIKDFTSLVARMIERGFLMLPAISDDIGA